MVWLAGRGRHNLELQGSFSSFTFPQRSHSYNWVYLSILSYLIYYSLLRAFDLIPFNGIAVCNNFYELDKDQISSIVSQIQGFLSLLFCRRNKLR